MPRFVKTVFHAVLLMVLMAANVHCDQVGSTPANPVPAKVRSAVQSGPQLVFPKPTYTFGEVFEGTEVKYDFIIENHGDAPLVIKSIRPD